MKKMRLLPSAVLAANLLLAAVFLSSCEDKTPRAKEDKRIYEPKLPDQIETERGYRIYTIDSCEYIYAWFGGGYGGGSLTHKGNCKFCATRHSR